jgi:hypothetical protein
MWKFYLKCDKCEEEIHIEGKMGKSGKFKGTKKVDDFVRKHARHKVCITMRLEGLDKSRMDILKRED